MEISYDVFFFKVDQNRVSTEGGEEEDGGVQVTKRTRGSRGGGIGNHVSGRGGRT